MTSLEAFFPDSSPCNYCLVCQHVIQIGRKGIRVVNLETYACCGLSDDVLAVRKEQGVRAPLAAVHGACYISQLQPRLRVLREQAAAVPRTRAAVKSLPPKPARRAPAGAGQKLGQLQNETAHITGVLPSASQRRTAARAQATSMLRLAGEQAPAGAAGGGVTHMETSPQESPGRGGVAAPGACTSSSGHTGVSWDNSKQAYRARSSCKLSGVSGQPRHLGHYPTSHDAAAAVNLYHEVLAWCLTWGVEVEPPPNAVPAGVALGRAEEAYVRSCALNAELDFWRAKEAALTAQLAEERRSSCADYLTACQLVPELASFVTTIATGGVLPGDLVVEYAMDAVTNAAKLREGGPAANGVRWRSRIKVVAAAAAAQCSGEATLNVLRGDVKDPGLPFPSTSTNRRTMGEDGVVPDATVGVLPTGIRKFVARCHVAGRPNADACMGTDGVDIPALLEKEIYPSGVRFAGDACLGDSIGVAALAQKEREYNSLVSRLDSSAARVSDAAGSHASVQHVAAWVQREVLPRARTSLREAQVASEAQDARFQRTNGGAMEAGEQQRLKQQQVVHKCASLQRIERAQTVVSLAEGLVRGAQRMHDIQLVSVTVGVLSPEGRITVALTPAGSDAEAACAEAVVLLARDMRAALPQLYDVLRHAATSMVVAFLTSPDSSVSELVARMYVGGKAGEQTMRRLIADVAVALATEAKAQQQERRLAEKEQRRQEEERLQQLLAKAAPQPAVLPAAQQAAALPVAAAAAEEEPPLPPAGSLLMVVTDGEHFSLTNAAGGGAHSSNLAQLNRECQKQCAAAALVRKRTARGQEEVQLALWRDFVQHVPLNPPRQVLPRGAATSAAPAGSIAKMPHADALLGVVAAHNKHQAAVKAAVAAAAAAAAAAAKAPAVSAAATATEVPPPVQQVPPPAPTQAAHPAAPARPKRTAVAPARYNSGETAVPAKQAKTSTTAVAPLALPAAAPATAADPLYQQLGAFCMVCGSKHSSDSNDMLFCDGPRCSNESRYAGWHQKCLTPAVTMVPQGDWFCPRCVTAESRCKEQGHRSGAQAPTPRQQQAGARLLPAALPASRLTPGLQPLVSDLYSSAGRLAGSIERRADIYAISPQQVQEHGEKVKDIEAHVPWRQVERPVQQLARELEAHSQAAQQPGSMDGVSPQVAAGYHAYMAAALRPQLPWGADGGAGVAEPPPAAGAAVAVRGGGGTAAATATGAATSTAFRAPGLANGCSGCVDAAADRKDTHASRAASRAAAAAASDSVLDAEAAGVLQLVRQLPVREGTAVVSRLVWRSQYLARHALLLGDRVSTGADGPSFPFASGMAEAEAYWVYRLTHGMMPAGLAPATAEQIVQQAVDQARLDSAVLVCKEAGRDFTRQFHYTAEGIACMVVDEPHKLKTAKPQDNPCCFLAKLDNLASMQRVATHGRLQPGTAAASTALATATPLSSAAALAAAAARVAAPCSPQLSPSEAEVAAAAAACKYGESCLDKGVLLEVAAELQREYQTATLVTRAAKYPGLNPSHLIAILRGETDAQSVNCAQYWIGCAPLQEALRERGFVREAVVMRTLMEAFEAFDECGLEPVERALRITRRTIMLQRMLGNTLFTARVCRGGAQPTLPQYVDGFTLQNVCSWLINGDSRLEVVERLPAERRSELCERALSSDCCELFFSLLTTLCGGRPALRVIQGAMTRITFLLGLRQQTRTARGFSMRRRRTRGAYKEHELMVAAALLDPETVSAGRVGISKWNSALKIKNRCLKIKRQKSICKTAGARANGKMGHTRQVMFNKPKLATGVHGAARK